MPNELKLEDIEKKLAAGVTTALENVKTELEGKITESAAAKVKEELEKTIEAQLETVKKEMVELSRPSVSALPATDIELKQLARLQAALPAGEPLVTLEAWRKYKTDLEAEALEVLRGKKDSLETTLAGYAGYDDTRGGALIVPEVDRTIYTDYKLYDTGLMDSINFEMANSRSLKVVVDTLEPDANVKAAEENLRDLPYVIGEGGFVETTLTLKDYENPARITYDLIEDSAFRIEPYVNGKLNMGCYIKAAKDLVVGTGANSIRGLINYPVTTGEEQYGKVQVVKTKTANEITLADIINLCVENHNVGVLYIDKATWTRCITERATDGAFVLNLGYTRDRNAGVRPYHVDDYVPFTGVPVMFDSGFALPETVASNVVAAILPPSALVGYKRPFGRFMIKDKLRYKEMLLTERYDVALAKFNYVKLLAVQ